MVYEIEGINFVNFNCPKDKEISLTWVHMQASWVLFGLMRFNVRLDERVGTCMNIARLQTRGWELRITLSKAWTTLFIISNGYVIRINSKYYI